MRLRVTLIIVGALLVIATYTFPLWQPYLRTIDLIPAPNEAFSGLALSLQTDYLRLPPDQQSAYQELADRDRDLAVRMLTAALQPGAPAPAADVEVPTLNSPIIAARGVFTRIDPIRWAQGGVVVYVGADDRKILRFEDFAMINGGDLRVILSTAVAPATAEAPGTPEHRLVTGLDFDAGVLRGTFGTQNYELPVELDLSQYGSVVIYSPSLDTIYSIAPLVLFT